MSVLNLESSLDSVTTQVVEELIDKLQSGEADIESFIADHPEHEAALRRLLPALQIMADVGQASRLPNQESGIPLLTLNLEPGNLNTSLGDYRILREVGRGGMGVVYEAEQLSLRRRVALKVLPFASALDPRQLQRFRNEALAAASLHHEHIIPVYAVGCERGVHFYAMQFIDGHTLAEIIAELRGEPDKSGREGEGESGRQEAHQRASTVESARLIDTRRKSVSLSPTLPLSRSAFHRRTAELIADAADALDHAHSLGIVHRDIKPGNLLLDQAGKILIGDFGLARFGPDAGLTMTGDILGTLRYMAPEQALAKHGLVDHRADIYALGATLYELLTLHPVVAASERAEILRQIAFEEPAPPHKLDKALPPELETITLKCLSKTPADRYSTAGELAHDLRRWLDDKPIKAKPPSFLQRTAKWSQRNQTLMLAVLAALLLGTTVSAWQAVRATQAEAQANANEAQAKEAAAAEAKQRQRAEANEQQANQQRDEAQKQRDEVRTVNKKLEATQDELKSTLYASNMNLAQQTWLSGGAERVRQLLELHHPRSGEADLRGFEWYYLHRLCHQGFLTLRGHQAIVNSVAYSPDGTRVASAARDGLVKIWDANSGQELLKIRTVYGGAWTSPESIAFSPDGQCVAGAYASWKLRIWDAYTGKERLTIPVPSDESSGTAPDFRRLSFSPDGKRLVGGSPKGEVYVWDSHTGEELLTFQGFTRGTYGLTHSPDGTRLAGTAGNEVRVWDATTGETLLSFKGGTWSVVFSPDGQRLAGASYNNTVRIWDAKTGNEIRSLKGGPGSQVAYSPDGKLLAASTSSNTVTVWDSQTGEERFVLSGHTEDVWSLAFSPDSQKLASASADKSVKIWDLRARPLPPTLAGAQFLRLVAFSPDGTRVAANQSGRSVKVWSAETGQELFELKPHKRAVTCIAFQPEGRRLAACCGQQSEPNEPGEVKVWDAQSGQLMFTVSGGGQSVCFSADGKRVASGAWDGTVPIWDSQTGSELSSFRVHSRDVTGIAFSPDGTRLASCGFANNPSWRIKDGDGVKVWDTQSGEAVWQHAVTDPFARFTSVAFSPDGKRLAATSFDKTIKVWEAETGQPLLTCTGHTDHVLSVAYTPDGKRLFSTGEDGSLKLWDAKTGQELLSFHGHIPSAATSPAGYRLFGVSTAGMVKTYDATPPAIGD